MNTEQKTLALLNELLKMFNDPTYGDNVWRLLIVEQSEKIIKENYIV